MDCPTCDRNFSSEQGVKIHHIREHDESIAGELVECSFCGKELRRKPSAISDNNFCDTVCKSKWQQSITGEDHHLYNRVTIVCDNCGNSIDKKPSRVRDNNFCDVECEAEWRSNKFSGDGHPQYIDGRSFERYYNTSEWKNFRDEMRVKLDTDCQICGCSPSDRQNSLHHIVPVREFESMEEANTEDNVVFLCQSHHVMLENMTEKEQRKELSSNLPNIES